MLEYIMDWIERLRHGYVEHLNILYLESDTTARQAIMELKMQFLKDDPELTCEISPVKTGLTFSPGEANEEVVKVGVGIFIVVYCYTGNWLIKPHLGYSVCHMQRVDASSIDALLVEETF